MQRRNFIRGFIALGSCAVCANLGFSKETKVSKGDAHGGAEAPHWEYRGKHGPDHWAEIDRANKVCAVGNQQSPIDLKGSIRADVEPLSPKWNKGAAKIINNGHTIQVNMPSGNVLKRDGLDYELLQFHFHAPSEHLVDDKAYPMEMHFVHRHAESGKLAVVGVFLTPGETNSTFAALAGNFPQHAGDEGTVPAFTPAELLPSSLHYWTYEGSLTTPPCSEIVTWLVVSQPLTVSAEDIKRFTSIYSANARPVLPTNRRILLLSSN